MKCNEKRQYNASAKVRRGGQSDKLKQPNGGRIMRFQDGSTYARVGKKAFEMSIQIWVKRNSMKCTSEKKKEKEQCLFTSAKKLHVAGK